ncbi:DUF2935 domain-containing protein [Pseudalkalibacillus sp. A8]|uniref:DUF2935 domain-containing protein n=1 Tax=Pseudalkalibacillus sp. A8 TaxID=3382641 RepID=UPI0038B5D2C0
MAKRISVWEEHAFWLEILGDHAHFLRDYLSPTEGRWVDLANQYIQAFNYLRQKLQLINQNLPPSSPAMIEMAKEIQPVAEGYYKFEGYMQKLRILNQVNLNLTPTYLNGTLNENQEYLRLLMFYIHGKNAEELSLVDTGSLVGRSIGACN